MLRITVPILDMMDLCSLMKQIHPFGHSARISVTLANNKEQLKKEKKLINGKKLDGS